MLNQKITDLFEEMAVLLDMSDVAFKPRAYEKAAHEIHKFPEDIVGVYKRDGRKGLEAIPSVGAGMALKIEEFIKTGRVVEHEAMKKKFPVDIGELSAIEGVGPKMIKTLYTRLGIATVNDLWFAAQKHRIRALPGMGQKTEDNILRGINFFHQSASDRKILGYVLPLAETIEARLHKVPGVKDALICGSVRRRQETIGDIDVLVTATKPSAVIETFTHMPEVVAVYAKGGSKSSVRLDNGINADVRVVAPESFGAAILYFTGDKTHNVELRKLAIAKKMKLNEYGLYRGKKLIAGRTEEEVYHALGLDFIPPELRTASQEIEAAAHGALPALLPYGSVRGDLQVQSEWTDGSASIAELAAAAQKLGREYIAITDHTKYLAMVGGLDEKKLAAQGKEIDALNKKFGKRFRILKGAEVNILKDGSLDINDTALAKLDVVGASVHTRLKMSREEMTARIIRAISNPHVDILFHPTDRLIGRRAPIEFDMDAILSAAKKYRVAMELDAYPDRTDLRDEHVRMAVAAGVKITIDSDAHAPDHLRFITFGEGTARRGWATKKDVLNTMPADKLIDYFKKKR